MFDQFIGLGFDCEVVVQLRRLTGCAQAHLLDWQVTPHEALMHVLRTDFADYLRLPNLELSEDRQYLLDTATGVRIHHLFPTNRDGTIVPEQVAAAYPQVRQRADFLLQRWRATVASSRPVLYIRRDKYSELIDQQFVELRDVIRGRYPSHRFALVWARDTGAASVGTMRQLAEGVYEVELPVAQPIDERWQGDDACWDYAFSSLRRLRP